MRLALLTVGLIASVSCRADLASCLSAAKDSHGTSTCYAEEFTGLDKDLNTAYRNALRKIAVLPLDADRKKGVRDLLVNAQRNWVRFRDQDCGAVSAAFGSGTGHALGESECKIQLTRHRIEELSRWERW